MNNLTKMLIWLTIIALPNLSFAKTYKDEYAYGVESVYDGDTFRTNIPTYGEVFGRNMPIRIANIDTPEIKGKCKFEKELAIKARDFSRKYLTSAKQIRLTNIKRGKYFRLVANVKVDNKDLGEMLLKNHLAYRYTGGRKKSWCK